MKLTSATPTSSAAAVDAVRRGFRIAFCRARNGGQAERSDERPAECPRERPCHEGAQRRETDEREHRSATDDVTLVTEIRRRGRREAIRPPLRG